MLCCLRNRLNSLLIKFVPLSVINLELAGGVSVVNAFFNTLIASAAVLVGVA